MGIEPSTLVASQNIIDQINYTKTAKHIDLKLLKAELKEEIKSRESLSEQIDFQSILSAMGHRLSKEIIEQCSISYYFISLLHLCNENNWELTSWKLNELELTVNKE
jgi:hypothetical protein